MAATINMVPDDMGDRAAASQHAGRMIYGATANEGNAASLPQSSLTGGSYSQSAIESQLRFDQQACCGQMSAVRRTFCLMAPFDLCLTFILWVIYTQSLNEDFSESMIDEVQHYSFRSSLFDTVLCSAWRSVPLLLAYALFRIRNPYIVAITTSGTCVFLLAKVFLFKFTGEKNHNNVMCYFLLVVSFIMAWIETWFLDFKVLPAEKIARQRELSHQRDSERAPLLSSHNAHNFMHHTDEYYSPAVSIIGSDEEEERGAGDFHSAHPSRTHSRSASTSSLALSLGAQEREYQKSAQEAWEMTWTILHTEDGWKLEAGTSLEDGQVFTRNWPKMGKLFKLEGYLDASVEDAFHETVIKIDDAAKWNPTISEIKTLQVVDDCTDINYNVAAEAAGGLVSSRDFVTLRHWNKRGDVWLSAGTAVSHPDAPPGKTYVRGENKAGGWAFFPIPGEPDRCKFVWILNTDLKGWIPQYAVDAALSGTLREFLQHLKNRLKVVTCS